MHLMMTAKVTCKIRDTSLEYCFAVYKKLYYDGLLDCPTVDANWDHLWSNLGVVWVSFPAWGSFAVLCALFVQFPRKK